MCGKPSLVSVWIHLLGSQWEWQEDNKDVDHRVFFKLWSTAEKALKPLLTKHNVCLKNVNAFLCVWQTLFRQKGAANTERGGDAVLWGNVYVPSYQQDEWHILRGQTEEGLKICNNSPCWIIHSRFFHCWSLPISSRPLSSCFVYLPTFIFVRLRAFSPVFGLGGE